MQIRFLQYNIAACRNYDLDTVSVDHKRTLEAIRSFNADIITLNEVDKLTKRSGEIDQTEFFAKELGYNSYYAPTIDLQGGQYGIALLSKYKILSVEQVRIPDTVRNKETGAIYESRTMYSAILDAEGTQVRVIGTHYGLTTEEQEKAVDTTLSLIEKSELPTIFSGDLNMKPDNPLIAKLSERLCDTSTASDNELYTFPSYIGKNTDDGNGYRKIDYVFTNGMKTESTEAPEVKVSDHRPLFCVLSV